MSEVKKVQAHHEVVIAPKDFPDFVRVVAVEFLRIHEIDTNTNGLFTFEICLKSNGVPPNYKLT